ncbi:GTPase-activating protein RGS2 LALA0_S09e04940g [Lachancea lanzarotensis]|uniref:LALA0S09e04940g1_1 n=1 Tax=Lachancea lanzarotensis TaxID=1245769 RepID=A0A0C7N187_9SACH|nr:uncharacterized protein LALA0_S09e04940g [Lachancea lanzarotensis]CEP63897.1 LALA0S09e04940g1_1 [Lachancea lanzarotensis]
MCLSDKQRQQGQQPLSLEKLLEATRNPHRPASSDAFVAFLKRSHCDENLSFLLATDPYVQGVSWDALASWTRDVYTLYIQTDSPRECNLPQAIRQTFDESAKSHTVPPQSSIEAARKHVLWLLQDAHSKFSHLQRRCSRPATCRRSHGYNETAGQVHNSTSSSTSTSTTSTSHCNENNHQLNWSLSVSQNSQSQSPTLLSPDTARIDLLSSFMDDFAVEEEEDVEEDIDDVNNDSSLLSRVPSRLPEIESPAAHRNSHSQQTDLCSRANTLGSFSRSASSPASTPTSLFPPRGSPLASYPVSHPSTSTATLTTAERSSNTISAPSTASSSFSITTATTAGFKPAKLKHTGKKLVHKLKFRRSSSGSSGSSVNPP